MKELEEFLVNIGLSEKEAKIYIYLLSVENANVGEISKKTKINRTTIYPITDSLMEKGLIEEIVKNDKNFFRALSPEKIETFIEDQKLKLYEKSKVAKNIIPKFKTIYRGEGERPVVEYYDGKKAIVDAAKSMFDDIGENKEEPSYIIYSRDDVENNFSKEDLDLIREKRIKKGIKTFSIYTYSKGSYVPDETGSRYKINEKEFPVKAEINVYADKLRIHTMGKNFGAIYIKSQDVSDTIRTLFKLAIKGLKK